jgi:SynChlorMet cassette radical SAM/SPASM protein ScmF
MRKGVFHRFLYVLWYKLFISMSENETSVEERKFQLNQIYFYLTEGCNLACRHCWIAPKYQSGEHIYPSLDLDLFKSILRQAKLMKVPGIKLTGGEPLLHPQIHEILEIIRTEGLGLTMETNGVLCTPEIAQQLSQIASSSKLFVSVSMDGADPETHEWIRGVKGSFEATLEGIRNLVSYNIHPQIIMTVMNRNKDQMEAMVRLAESLSAESVKYNVLQPTARGEKMHEQGETLPINELIEVGKWVETTLAPSSKLRVVYDHPVAFRPLSRMFGEGGGCSVCGIFGIIGVLADGSYALCGIGESVPELIFGHASKDRLEDVWDNSPVLKDIRTGLPERLEGICGDCLLKNRCLGSCIAQNYYRSRHLWAPFWFCEEANAKGLFPKTRLRSSLTQQ